LKTIIINIITSVKLDAYLIFDIRYLIFIILHLTLLTNKSIASPHRLVHSANIKLKGCTADQGQWAISRISPRVRPPKPTKCMKMLFIIV